MNVRARLTNENGLSARLTSTVFPSSIFRARYLPVALTQWAGARPSGSPSKSNDQGSGGMTRARASPVTPLTVALISPA